MLSGKQVHTHGVNRLAADLAPGDLNRIFAKLVSNSPAIKQAQAKLDQAQRRFGQGWQGWQRQHADNEQAGRQTWTVALAAGIPRFPLQTLHNRLEASAIPRLLDSSASDGASRK